MVNRAKFKRFARASVGTAFVISAGAAESACRSPTEITFLITTDEKCSSVTGSAISVGALGASLDSKPPATTSTFCDDQTHSLGSLVVVPSGERDAELAVRIVTGTSSTTDDCIKNNFTGGCIVARRALHFIPHSPITVPVEMDASCIGVPCTPNSTCHNGACVPVTVDCLEGTCDAGSTSVQAGSGSWKTMNGSPLSARAFTAFVGLGTSLFVWGGYTVDKLFVSDGAIYNSDSDSWTALPPSPLAARGFATTIITAAGEVVIWGGSDNDSAFNDGAIFSNGTWTPLPPAPIAPRERAVGVFANDNNELVVWGGDDAQNPRTFFADGAAYSFTTKKWRMLNVSTISARFDASAVYSGGTAMVVFGGSCGTSGICGDYGIYRPSNDTWYGPYTSPLSPRTFPAAVQIGSTADVLFFGGSNGAVAFADGTDITPHDQSSVPIASPGSVLQPAARAQMASWSFGNVMYVWGGNDLTNDVGNGALYDTVAKTWAPMSSTNAPSARSFPATSFTGTKAIVWGGQVGVSPNISYKNDGAVFTP